MRIGIIGIGDICKKAYLPLLATKEEIELVLCSRNENTVNEIKNKYRIKEGYNNIDQLISSGIDAAMVHSSTNSHFLIVKQLLENNIVVYVDKPLSSDYKEAKELYDISKKYNGRIMVGFNRRFVPKVKELKEIGNPDIIIMEKNRFNLPGEVRTFITDDFIHVIDTVRFLMGKNYDEISIKHKSDERGLLNVVLTLSNKETTAIAIMNRDNGTTEEVLEYMSSGKKVVVNSLVKSTSFEKNKIIVEEFGDWISTLYKRGFEGIIEEFISKVKSGEPFNPSIEDSLISHEICEKIIKSIS